MVEADSAPQFDLFVSYVRRDVRRRAGRRTIDVVAVLKTELERHRRPKEVPGKDARFRVCTDLDDFALDGTFDRILRDRIGRSRCFLLVASPNAGSSRFVQRELDILQNMRPAPPRMAAVLGALPADAAPGLFDADVIAADLDQPEGTSVREWRDALRRESHKIVAQAWGFDPRAIYDRFEAERRTLRQRVMFAAGGVLIGAVALTIGLSGESGYHRSAPINAPRPFVSPAGVGFAEDGATPVIVRERQAFVWRRGPDEQPQRSELPFPVLRAIPAGPGQIAVSGLHDIAVIGFPDGVVQWQRTLPPQIEAMAFGADTIAATTKDGGLAFFDRTGGAVAAPRPTSQTGRRFPAFRETGPFRYGEVLALNDRFLASATHNGRLGILDRTTSRFVVAATPQFALAEPIENTTDPVLYETENTRPISALAFLADGDLLLAEGAGLRRVDPATGKLTALSHCAIELVRQILPLSDRHTIIALTSSTFEVLRFDPHDRSRVECLQRTTFAPKSIPRAALAADGRTVLIAFFDALPELWRPGYKLFGTLLPLDW